MKETVMSFVPMATIYAIASVIAFRGRAAGACDVGGGCTCGLSARLAWHLSSPT